MRTSVKALLAVAILGSLALAAAVFGASSGLANPANPQPPGVIAVPTVTGLQVGQTLVGWPGTWGGGTPMTFTYFWLRSGPTGYTAIPGANGTTYTVTDADLGHTLFFQVKASNEDGYSISSSTLTSIVTGATASGTQTLPDGGTSVLVDNVSLPDRLVVQTVEANPTTMAVGGSTSVHILVTDVTGHPVRGALVSVVPFPYGAVTKPAEVATGNDGTVTVTLNATKRLTTGTKLVGLYVQARKTGDNILSGVTGTRLVNLSVTK